MKTILKSLASLTVFSIFLMSNEIKAQPLTTLYSIEYFMVDGNNVIEKKLFHNEPSGALGFSFSSKVDWWKEIRIFDKDGKVIRKFSFENVKDSMESITYDEDLFGDEIKIEFWKAKAFGVHTHVATKYFKKSDIINRRLHFTWMND